MPAHGPKIVEQQEYQRKSLECIGPGGKAVPEPNTATKYDAVPHIFSIHYLGTARRCRLVELPPTQQLGSPRGLWLEFQNLRSEAS